MPKIRSKSVTGDLPCFHKEICVDFTEAKQEALQTAGMNKFCIDLYAV
ncbi:MAG: hypothetical protein K2I05_04920 [Mailhella sp.]|nr:hypothetical protein [Mailhella sp.]